MQQHAGYSNPHSKPPNRIRKGHSDRAMVDLPDMVCGWLGSAMDSSFIIDLSLSFVKRPGLQFLSEYTVDHSRVGLTFRGLHHLSDEEAHDFGLPR